jgi:hypothetical protein
MPPEETKPEKPLIDKLGVKPGMQVLLLGVDDARFLADLRARTEGIVVEAPTSARPTSVSRYDAIFVAVNEPQDMEQFAYLKDAIQPDGAVWAVFRKGRKDFNENAVLRGGLDSGLVDVKVVRFSDTHTASKFVIRKAERGAR